jgi:hypothetical protein
LSPASLGARKSGTLWEPSEQYLVTFTLPSEQYLVTFTLPSEQYLVTFTHLITINVLFLTAPPLSCYVTCRSAEKCLALSRLSILLLLLLFFSFFVSFCSEYHYSVRDDAV